MSSTSRRAPCRWPWRVAAVLAVLLLPALLVPGGGVSADDAPLSGAIADDAPPRGGAGDDDALPAGGAGADDAPRWGGVMASPRVDHGARWRLDVLEDTQATLAIGDLSAPQVAARFVPASGPSVNLGFTDSALWARLTLDLPPGHDWVVQVAYPLLDEISFYARASDGGWRRQEAGDTHPFALRDVKHRTPSFLLPARDGGEQVVYLRAQTRGSLQLPIAVWQASAFHGHVSREHLVLGVYYGMMLVMVLYNLFLFFSVRDRAYLHYVGFIASFMTMQLALNGLAYQYLWPEQVWWGNRASVVLPGVVGLFGLAFSRSLLNTRALAPRMDRLMIWLSLAIVVEIAGALFASYRVAASLSALLAVMFVMTVMPAAFASWRRGYRPARFFLLAWAAFLTGVLITGLLLFGLVPSNPITAHAMQVGSGLEVILLSLALADRINVMQHERERAQAEVVRMERNAKRELEALVRARTVELENKNAMLSELAARDPLTGLYNRRVFLEQFTRALEGARRGGDPVALVLLDLDRFKSINDTWGHPVGDRVLRDVAGLLERQRRASDVCGRFGGEEFALLLHGCTPQQAVVGAERVRAALEAIRIGTTPEVEVTASFGVCGVPSCAGSVTVNEVIRRADDALYEAKTGGRNRVCLSDSDGVPAAVTRRAAQA